MKKIIAIVLTAAMLLSLCACGGNSASATPASPANPAKEEVENPTEEVQTPTEEESKNSSEGKTAEPAEKKTNYTRYSKDGQLVYMNPITEDQPGRTPKEPIEYWEDGVFDLENFLVDNGLEKRYYLYEGIWTREGVDYQRIMAYETFVRLSLENRNYENWIHGPSIRLLEAVLTVSCGKINDYYTTVSSQLDAEETAQKLQEFGITEDKWIPDDNATFSWPDGYGEQYKFPCVVCKYDNTLFPDGIPVNTEVLMALIMYIEWGRSIDWDRERIGSGDISADLSYDGGEQRAKSASGEKFGELWGWSDEYR